MFVGRNQFSTGGLEIPPTPRRPRLRAHQLLSMSREELDQGIAHAPDAADESRYQTVYARVPGAVAAPTAGLHFDESALASLKSRGISFASVTLHVGAGTFQPVRVEEVGIAKHVTGRAISNNTTAIEQDRPAAQLQDHLQVVGGDQLGRMQARDQLDEPAPAARVQVGRRLVEDQDRGVTREDTGQADPLAFAEAEVVRHSLGLKAPRGYGWLTNPKRAAYNRVYNRSTVGLGKGCAVAFAYLAGATQIVVAAGTAKNFALGGITSSFTNVGGNNVPTIQPGTAITAKPVKRWRRR